MDPVWARRQGLYGKLARIMPCRVVQRDGYGHRERHIHICWQAGPPARLVPGRSRCNRDCYCACLDDVIGNMTRAKSGVLQGNNMMTTRTTGLCLEGRTSTNMGHGASCFSFYLLSRGPIVPIACLVVAVLVVAVKQPWPCCAHGSVTQYNQKGPRHAGALAVEQLNS